MVGSWGLEKFGDFLEHIIFLKKSPRDSPQKVWINWYFNYETRPDHIQKMKSSNSCCEKYEVNISKLLLRRVVKKEKTIPANALGTSNRTSINI